MRIRRAWHVPSDELARYTAPRAASFAPRRRPGRARCGNRASRCGWPTSAASRAVLQKTLAREISLRGMFVFPVNVRRQDARRVRVLQPRGARARPAPAGGGARHRQPGRPVPAPQAARSRRCATARRASAASASCRPTGTGSRTPELRFTVMSGGSRQGQLSASPSDGQAPLGAAGGARMTLDWAAHRATLEAHQPFTDFEYRIRHRGR